MSNNTFKITAETITPVHIGNGVELNGNFEYLYFSNSNQIAILDSDKVLDIIGIENINHWVSIVDKGEDLLGYLKTRKKNLVIKDVASRIIDVVDKAPNSSKNKIKEQLHLGTSVQATVPGSSMKGSIRTAILTKLIKDDASFVRSENNIKHQYHKNKFEDKQIQGHYFGTNPNNDWLRFLRISDFSFASDTCVVKNNIINLFRNGWAEKREQSSFWECIPEGVLSEGSIQIPKELMEQIQNKKFMSGTNFNLLEPRRLFKLINKHTLELVSDEINFWEDEENPLAIGEYMTHLLEVEKMFETITENCCILRVGAGIGWGFMTGSWANGTDVYDDDILTDEVWGKLKRELRKNRYSDDVIFPKTRKLIDDGMPLGFVKLTIK